MVLDKGMSGGKRKNGSCEEKEGMRKSACGRGHGRVKGESSEPEEEEESSEPEEEEEEEEEEVEETGPDVLRCPICFNPLTPRIYQCRNGHIVCSHCCPKLKNRCHVCSQPLGRRRCIALEKVIESIKSPCKHANFGCRAILSFAEKVAHEKYCRYPSLFCPISNCRFFGSRSLLFAHAKQNHLGISMNFLYNRFFMIALKNKQPFMILLGEDGYIYLLLNTRENCRGNMLSVICMGPSIPEDEEFLYELKADAGGSSLQLRTSVQKMIQWNGVHTLKAFLVVPDGFFASSRLSINVRIYK
ncbi:putative E3 ubiquitin-protein ligase SINA-like 6 [Phalaenopsis equestris]|uniref:putative E3 ubiquitin-protein ligase SINA-like 6 n=1 Tax=Phalaenopsis equestris TaxID=78828 RepID=UPI0009E238E6|nr:putative E3 ubiquitin-protein ligase SINA-like 6 [Phalaenopsis equestris]